MNWPKLSLRCKLSLVSLLLLSTGLVGIWQAAAMHRSLLDARQQSLVLTTRAIASIFRDRFDLFEPGLQLSASGQPLGVYLLQHPIQLDGRTDDWENLLPLATSYGRDNVLEGSAAYDPQSFSFRFLGGRHGQYLYALFMVEDKSTIFRQKNAPLTETGDHLRIAVENGSGLLDFYVLSPDGPGLANAFLVPGGPDRFAPAFNETRIEGFWKQTTSGYNIELRIPFALLKNRLSFALADIDDPGTRLIKTVIGTGRMTRREELGLLLADNSGLQRLIKPLQQQTTRIWLVDWRKRLLALAGSLDSDGQNGYAPKKGGLADRLLQPLVEAVQAITPSHEGKRATASREFDLRDLDPVLAGSEFTGRRIINEDGLQVIAAAEPFFANGEVLGAVVVEEQTDSILTARNRMLEQIMAVTVLLFLLAFTVLFAFGSRLSGRIRRLRRQTEQAIGKDGRILGSFQPSLTGDELGELSRQQAAIIARLRDFHRHQDKMADTLEHELRTPLAGVSASLTNLRRQLETPDRSIAGHLADAGQNLKRMEEILTGIREAAALEEALRQDEPEKIDLCRALAAWVEYGYRKTFSKVGFSLTACQGPVHILADQDRIRQMMDKLVENAVDFSPPGATVMIRLQTEDDLAVLSVLNEGPCLDEKVADQLFHSMVSLRQGKKDREVHMGLGLFIVRSIVEFHGGTVEAANRWDGIDGAVFTVRLPLHSWAENISIKR